MNMEEQDLRPTRKTGDLVGDWERAALAKVDAESRLRLAKEKLGEAERNLGDFLTPPNAFVGESFQIWVGARLLVITSSTNNRSAFEIRWRADG